MPARWCMNSIVESSTRKQPASRMRIPFLDDSTLYICRWSPFRIVTSPQNQAGLGLGCGCLTIGVYNSGTTDGPTPQYGISPDSARRATSVAKGRFYRISVSHEKTPMKDEREGVQYVFMTLGGTRPERLADSLTWGDTRIPLIAEPSSLGIPPRKKCRNLRLLKGSTPCTPCFAGQ